MKSKFKVGQIVTLPAIKSRNVRRSKAVVVALPLAHSNVMEVRELSMPSEWTLMVQVSRRTGRILAKVV